MNSGEGAAMIAVGNAGIGLAARAKHALAARMSPALVPELTERIDRDAQRDNHFARLPLADGQSLQDDGNELSLGAHVVTPRGAYVHHGIYVGNGLVVHYGGLVRGLRTGPVEAVSMEQFTQGRPLRVLLDSSPYFSRAEVVQRALSRIGEDRYQVLTNNCEHFCEWCLHAEQRSYQVDRWLRVSRRMIAVANRFTAKLLAPCRRRAFVGARWSLITSGSTD